MRLEMKFLVIFFTVVCVKLCSGFGKRMCMPSHPQAMFCKADYAIRVKVLSEVKEEFWSFSTDSTTSPVISSTRPMTSPTPSSTTSSVVNSSEDIIEVQKDAAGLKYASAERPGHSVKYQEVRVDRIMKGKGIIRKYSKNGKKEKKPVVRIYLNQAELNDTSVLIVGKVIQGKLWVSFCDWCTSWKSLTTDQKKGLKRHYRLNCECEVMVAFDTKSKYRSSVKGCYWVPDFSYSTQLSDDCGFKHQYCYKNKRGYCEMTRKSYLKCINNRQP